MGLRLGFVCRSSCLGLLLGAVACGGNSKPSGSASGAGGEAGEGNGGTSGEGGTAAAGTGATGGSSGSGGSTGVALEEVPGELARLSCAAFLRCSPHIAPLLTEASCVDTFEKRILNQTWSAIEDAVAEGRALYDGEAMALCLADRADANCTALDEEPESCAEAAVGTVARGEACLVDVECAGDSICHFNGACPGTCSARLSAGESCEEDNQCREGLTCSSDTARCVAPAGDGEACEGGQAAVCAEGFFCVGSDEEAGTTGTCQPIDDVFSGEQSEACDFGQGPLCQPGLACVIDVHVEGETTFCTALADPGARCLLGGPNPCTPGYYCRGASLTEQGVCTLMPDVGDACEAEPTFGDGGPPIPCRFGATCTDAKCVALKANGVACNSDAECLSEQCVSGGCSATCVE